MTARTTASLLGLHAQTALHPGAGTALGLVDLPVQRERHTGWPTIPGSALKGLLRDRCREQISWRNSQGQADEHFDLMTTDDETDSALADLNKEPKSLKFADATKALTTLFGPPTQWASEFAGALSITDARLVAFPVRSLRGVFAWVTCRAALERLAADASMASVPTDWKPIEVSEERFAASSSSQCVHDQNFVILEEFDFTKEATVDPAAVDAIADWLTKHVMTAVPAERLRRQLVILNDDDFTHFARHATEITARIKLNYETKTVAKGALFYQEFLPAETVLYTVVIANPSRSRKENSKSSSRNERMEPPKVLASLRNLMMNAGDGPTVLQIGGDETTGKGLCLVSFPEVIA